MDHVVIVVIAPSRDAELALLSKEPETNSDWLCVSIDSSGKKQNNIDANMIFLLINQEQDEDDLAQTFNSFKASRKKAIVYTHRSQSTSGDCTFQPISEDKIKKYLADDLLYCEYFSHDSAKPYLDFMKLYGIDEWGKNKKLLELLVKEIATKKIELLRSKLLAPLVCIDWLTQMTQTDDPLMTAIKTELETSQYKKTLEEMEKIFETPEPDFMIQIKHMISSNTVNHAVLQEAADKLENAIQNLLM